MLGVSIFDLLYCSLVPLHPLLTSRTLPEHAKTLELILREIESDDATPGPKRESKPNPKYVCSEDEDETIIRTQAKKKASVTTPELCLCFIICVFLINFQL